MNYIPFTSEITPQDLTGLVVLNLMLVLFSFFASVGVFGAGQEKKLSKRQRTFGYLILLGIAVFGLTNAFSIGTTFKEQKLAYDEDIDDWYVQVSDGFTERYGIEVTPDDVSDLWYPETEPSGKEYYGTTIISTGPEASSFKKVTLSVTDGKAYLLTQIGEEYEELSPAAQ